MSAQELTAEQVQLADIRFGVAALPEESRQVVERLAEQFRELIRLAPIAAAAIAPVGAEIAADEPWTLEL